MRFCFKKRDHKFTADGLNWHIYLLPNYKPNKSAYILQFHGSLSPEFERIFKDSRAFDARTVNADGLTEDQQWDSKALKKE